MLITKKYLTDLLDWKVSSLEVQLADLKSSINVKNLARLDEIKKKFDDVNERFKKALDLMREVVLTLSPTQKQLDFWYEQYQEL